MYLFVAAFLLPWRDCNPGLIDLVVMESDIIEFVVVGKNCLDLFGCTATASMGVVVEHLPDGRWQLDQSVGRLVHLLFFLVDTGIHSIPLYMKNIVAVP